MPNKYRLFRRANGIYFIQDNQTGQQESLRTRDKKVAQRLFNARNEAHQQPFLNLQIARGYLAASDPSLVQRTWKDVMEAFSKTKRGETKVRADKAIKHKAYDSIRQVHVIETRAEQFLAVLENSKPSVNVYLRRLHNFALSMDWLLKPVIPRREWPKPVFRKKRAITYEEHVKIIEREENLERRHFYEMLWHLGGSQGDVANLCADDVDWSDWTIGYDRSKLRNQAAQPGSRVNPAIMAFGEELAALLRKLPKSGPLFPYLSTVEAKDRATEFHQRCQGLGIHGVTLHSYRFAWAERARKCGFPMRYAQEALGHNSKAVHVYYARQAEVKLPSLEAWEKEMKKKVTSLDFRQKQAPQDTAEGTAQAQ